MTTESALVRGPESAKYTAIAAVKSGDMVMLPCGLAGQASASVDAGELVGVLTEGIVELTKTAGIALLAGGDVFWDISAASATFAPGVGTADFLCGVVEADAAAADTTVRVRLNARARYVVDLEASAVNGSNGWTSAKTAGGSMDTGASGLPAPGRYRLNLSSANEAQAIYVTSDRTIPAGAGAIFEARIAVTATGMDSGVDIDVGLATGGHASDFEAVSHFAAFHFDGALDVLTHSDDGSTDRAPADSTINATEATFHELWIDARDSANVQFYFDGALIDTELSPRVLTAAAGQPLKAIAMMEKAASTAVGLVQVAKLRVRCQAE
ncbi:MAG: DUF2190 family protein [Phycisphaerales bacterium]|nr:DUF2190 family protein [Phycisphaerales bacterium]